MEGLQILFRKKNAKFIKFKGDTKVLFQQSLTSLVRKGISVAAGRLGTNVLVHDVSFPVFLVQLPSLVPNLSAASVLPAFHAVNHSEITA